MSKEYAIKTYYGIIMYTRERGGSNTDFCAYILYGWPQIDLTFVLLYMPTPSQPISFGHTLAYVHPPTS